MKKTLSLLLGLVLVSFSCTKNSKFLSFDLNPSQESKSVFNSNPFNFSNVFSAPYSIATERKRVRILMHDPDVQLLAKFQRKFSDKIMNSKINLSNTKLLMSDALLDSIGWNKKEFETERQAVREAAARLRSRYNFGSSSCSQCTFGFSSEQKMLKTINLLKAFKKDRTRLDGLNNVLDFFSGKNNKKQMAAMPSTFRVMDLTTDEGGSSDPTDPNDITDPSTIDPGTGGDGAPAGTKDTCSWGGYIACLIVCAGTIESRPLQILCSYGCYCGFCSGPARDQDCAQQCANCA